MREALVTRTIATTEATVLCVDILAGSTFTQVVPVPRTYKDNAQLLKAVAKAVDTDTEDTKVKVVSIISSEVKETLYGMTEQEFITLAKVLPPRGTKKEAEEVTE